MKQESKVLLVCLKSKSIKLIVVLINECQIEIGVSSPAALKILTKKKKEKFPSKWGFLKSSPELLKVF